MSAIRFVCLAWVVTGLLGAATGSAGVYRNTVLTDNPTYYWNFDEASGNAIDQVAGGGSNDNLVPGVQAGRGGSAATGLGNAALFNGLSDTRYISAGPLTQGILANRYAIEFFVKAPDNAARYILSNGTNGPAVVHGFQSNAGLELYAAGAGRTGAGVNQIDDGQWHHVVIGNSHHPGELYHRIYVDGKYVGQYGLVNSSWNAGQTLYVGASSAGNWFNGKIDELAVYNLGSEPDAAAFNNRLAGMASHNDLIARYLYSGAHRPSSANANYLDPENRKLNDGVVGSGVVSNNTWVGVLNSVDDGQPHPQIDFNLGGSRTVDAVQVHYDVVQVSGVYAPDSVQASFSNDGVNFFGTTGPLTGFKDADGVRAWTVDLPDTTARHVRLQFLNDREWTFLGEVEFFDAMPPVPVAGYTYGTAPSPSYPDSTGGELIDGIFGSGTYSPTTQYVGFQDTGADDGIAQPEITFALADPSRLNKMKLEYLVDHESGIYAPDQLTIHLSGDAIFGNGDDTVLTKIGIFDDASDLAGGNNGDARSLTIALGDVFAQHVRLDFRNDHEWTFLSEVTFYGVPEPGTMLLLVLGGLTLAPAWRWRRRCSR